MDLREMRCFAEVSKAGSYSKASETLFITRQALSRTIAKLEEETKLHLLDSDKNGVRLTDEGAAFLAEITPLLESYDNLEAKYVGIKHKSILNIALSQGALHPFPEDFLSKFIESAPDIDVHIEEIHSDGTLLMVEKGDAELGILGSHPKYLTDFDCLDLGHPGYHVSVPKWSPLASYDHFELEDMDGVPFVTLGERNHLHRFFIEQCRKVDVYPNIVVATSDMNVFEHFRTKDSALAFACAPDSTQPYKDVVYIPLNMADADLFGTYVIKKRDVTLSNAARRLWDYFAEHSYAHDQAGAK